MSDNQYNVAILGAGPGGYVAAIRAAQLGASVALIESRQLGGTCLNRGCIPTKAMLESVHVLSLAKHARDYGVVVADAEADLAAMNARKEKVVETLRNGIAALMKKNKVDVLLGRGRLKNAHTLVVTDMDGDTHITADKIILATGSEPLELPMFPVDHERVITSDDALNFDHVPESMLIIGAGAIGCEWAGIFGEMGTTITIVEMLDQVLPTMDKDVGKEIFKVFKKAKMNVHVKTKVESLEVTDDGVKAKLDNGKEYTVEKAMVCVGRKLNTDDIGLDAVGIETGRGAIAVDEHCRTAVPNIYAVGDITAKLMLAHLASKQGIVAAEHAMGRESAMDYRVVPGCIFTHPAVGAVGLTEPEAAGQGRGVKAAKSSYRALGRALALGAPDGFFKIVADADTGEVLGCHIVGANASDLIAEAALAMQIECTVEELAHTIHAHPTLAEGLMEAAEQWLDRPIHG